MGKKTKSLCAYMMPIEATKGRKPTNRGQSQSTVSWDATALVEAMYADNKRLIAENAVLRERAKVRVIKDAAIDVNIAEEVERYEQGREDF